MKQITWILIAVSLSIAPAVHSDDTERIIKQANRYVEPLGKENPYDNQSDLGLYELSKDEEDRMVFKVTSFRNVDRTAPYFHDGRIKTLPEAVRSMARLQLDQELTDQQVKEIEGPVG